MERFQGPGACLVVERIIWEGTDDASQEKDQSCLFVLERYRERSSSSTCLQRQVCRVLFSCTSTPWSGSRSTVRAALLYGTDL